VTGRPPFAGRNHYELLLKVMEEEPVAPRALRPDVDPRLEEVILRCLAKAPRDRPASAAALAEALAATVEIAPGLRRRSAGPAVAAAAVVVGAAGLAGAIVAAGRSGRGGGEVSPAAAPRAPAVAAAPSPTASSGASPTASPAATPTPTASPAATPSEALVDLAGSPRLGPRGASSEEERAWRAEVDARSATLARGDDPRARLERGFARWRLYEIGGALEDLAGAREDVAAGLAAAADDLALAERVMARSVLGRIARAEGDLEAAADAFERAVAASGDPERAEGELRQPLGNALLGRAELREIRGEYAGALDDYALAAELDPGLAADAHARRCPLAFYSGSAWEAAASLERALQTSALDGRRAAILATLGAELALRLLGRGAARRRLALAIRRDPSHRPAVIGLLGLLGPEAVPWLERGLATGEQDWLRVPLAWAVREVDPERADRLLARGLETAPEFADDLRNLQAELALRQGRLDDVAWLLEESLELTPPDDPELGGRAFKLSVVRVGDLDLVRAHIAGTIPELGAARLGRAVAEHGHLAGPWLLRAAVRAREGDLAGALADCRVAAARGDALGAPHLLSGQVLLRHGRYAEAQEAFDAALAAAPGDEAARLGRSEARYRLGGLEDLRGALYDLDVVLVTRPNHAGARRQRAAVFVSLDAPHAALAEAERALALLGREDPETLYTMAVALETLDRFAEMREVVRRGLRVAPDHAGLRARLALASFRLGDYGAAIEAAEEAIRLLPRDPRPRLVLGGALLETGELAAAEEALEEALSLASGTTRRQAEAALERVRAALGRRGGG